MDQTKQVEITAIDSRTTVEILIEDENPNKTNTFRLLSYTFFFILNTVDFITDMILGIEYLTYSETTTLSETKMCIRDTAGLKVGAAFLLFCGSFGYGCYWYDVYKEYKGKSRVHSGYNLIKLLKLAAEDLLSMIIVVIVSFDWFGLTTIALISLSTSCAMWLFGCSKEIIYAPLKSNMTQKIWLSLGGCFCLFFCFFFYGIWLAYPLLIDSYAEYAHNFENRFLLFDGECLRFTKWTEYNEETGRYEWDCCYANPCDFDGANNKEVKCWDIYLQFQTCDVYQHYSENITMCYDKYV